MRPTALCMIASALLCAFQTAPAQAQPTRVFVAAQGLDGNACTFAAPCRTFQRAHDAVAANGEIDVLDPAGYGPLTITKAISIQGHGFSGISFPNFGAGITISAGASDLVSLRGLILDGVATGQIGVLFNSGGTLDIEDCVIRNFSAGVYYKPSGSSAIIVSNTRLIGNHNNGILIDLTAATTVSGTLDRVSMEGATSMIGSGLTIMAIASAGSGAGTFTVSDSVISNNRFGIDAEATTGSVALMIRNSTVSNNSNLGVISLGGGCKVWITRSTIMGNGTGLSSNAGQLISYGDNNVDGNSTDGAPTSTIPLK